MREFDSSNWFSNWEDDLPRPEDLTPLSQTLISPPLALAFDIQTPSNPQFGRQIPPLPQIPSSGDFDTSSNELGGEPARTLKRPRLVWTPQLHKRFVDAVAHLGIKNAVPKTIMQMMSVDGLTRENVASHLQKYRQYLKRMQGHSGAGAGDAASDRLFASSPVPPHFLHPRQVAAMVAGGGYHQQQPHRWQVESQFGGGMHQNSGAGYVGGFESGASESGRRVLTLFPTGD